ncbi:WD repeat and SOCS box-containing protein 1-like [Elysia marginata]|uniref:WD repeat and SOCS box-containing protein 1-like n=1 Tax=Elysia marginata TaxID=1093978 RepID=A0AAV4HK05_9GAST|nr:WD repeat and SOCS box-containing protein 1-like [Elysia marginata]
MGLEISTIRQVLKEQRLSQPCYPLTRYTRLDKDKWPVNEDGLVIDFQILPRKFERGVDDGSWYWWCDAQFVRFSDDQLFATTSAFLPRAGLWTAVPNSYNGRIQVIKLRDPENTKTSMLSRTNSTVFPKVQPHPLGEVFAYCGTGEVVVMTKDGDPIYSRSRDISNAVHKYCAIAHNGVSVACLKRGMGVYFLETYILDSALTSDDSLRCHQVCPGFVPPRLASDFVTCKFSPDAKYIAVSSMEGHLFVVTKFKLEKHCIICPKLTDESLSAAEAFDFNPRTPHECLAVGTRDKNLRLLNMDTEEVNMVADIGETIDCVRFSRDGIHLAVGMRTFDISIYSSEDLNLLKHIRMSELCQNEMSRRVGGSPAVLNLSFSQDGGHLASCTCDGHVRVWRMPRLLSLMELSRNSVLQNTPICKVNHLKILPEKLRNFLLYKYF